jgi:hypothetical protein
MDPVNQIINIYKLLSEESKLELHEKLWIMAPSFCHFKPAWRTGIIKTDTTNIIYGNGRFIEQSDEQPPVYSSGGYYSNMIHLSADETKQPNDSVLFQLDTETMDKYDMHSDKDYLYTYEFYGNCICRVGSNEKIETLTYINDGYYAESKNHYYLLPFGIEIQKIVGANPYEVYQANKKNKAWLREFTNFNKMFNHFVCEHCAHLDPDT